MIATAIDAVRIAALTVGNNNNYSTNTVISWLSIAIYIQVRSYILYSTSVVSTFMNITHFTLLYNYVNAV